MSGGTIARMDRELERLDQEITLELQKIDGNLSHCFDVITKQVIPRVVAYGQVCDAISDSCEWLGTLCKSSGVVDLKRDVLLERTPVRDSDAHGNAHGDTHGNAHGDAHGEANAERSYGDVAGGEEHNSTVQSEVSDSTMGKYREDDTREQGEDDSVQRQKKRKVSLLIQERYGSSSSVMPSPDKRVPQQSLGSSPVKEQVPLPGTVIHFSTK